MRFIISLSLYSFLTFLCVSGCQSQGRKNQLEQPVKNKSEKEILTLIFPNSATFESTLGDKFVRKTIVTPENAASPACLGAVHFEQDDFYTETLVEVPVLKGCKYKISSELGVQNPELANASIAFPKYQIDTNSNVEFVSFIATKTDNEQQELNIHFRKID